MDCCVTEHLPRFTYVQTFWHKEMQPAIPAFRDREHLDRKDWGQLSAVLITSWFNVKLLAK